MLPYPDKVLGPNARAGWTAQEIALLMELHGTMPLADIASRVGRSRCAIRAQITRQGIAKRDDYWPEHDVAALKAAYSTATCNADLHLTALVESMGRNKANICRKARQLGLTDNSRKGVIERKDRRKYKTKEELSEALSSGQKRRLALNGHPRGMAGKKHSDQTKARLSETSSAVQQRLSAEEKAVISLKALRTRVDRYGGGAPNVARGSWKAGWREIGGKRIYARSRWEANYARYLEWLKQRGQIKDWQHEPETFWFEAIKRGVRSYLPDFRVWEVNGSSNLHEVKGWMDARSKTTLARMKRYHPNETIILIREKEYKAIGRQVSRMIDGWEASDGKARVEVVL